jgi:hypothetical protein
VVRKYSSTDTAPPITDEGNVPRYWPRPTRILSAEPGIHRFYWDFRYPTPAVSQSYPIAAVKGNTVKEPRGVWAPPGRYQVRLTAAGRSQVQPLDLRLDPRVRIGPVALGRQFALGRALAEALDRTDRARREIRAIRDRAKERRDRVPALGAEIDSVRTELERFDQTELGSLAGQLQQLYEAVEEVDAAPTSQLEVAVRDRQGALDRLTREWKTFREKRIGGLDAKLRAAGADPLERGP